MNLDTFLTLERRQLLEEQQWLETKRNNEHIVTQTNPNLRIISGARCLKQKIAPNIEISGEKDKVLVTKRDEEISPLLALPVLDEHAQLKQQQQIECTEIELTKDAKEVANNKKNSYLKQQPNEGDWVTDTFYSYFPGFSNEYQKRQNYLRERQRQNQENYLKYFPVDTNTCKENVLVARKRRVTVHRQGISKFNIENIDVKGDDDIVNRSMCPSTIRSSQTHDNADLEIIVTNPNYMPPKYGSARPDSTRQKLLQDLRHTELSQMIAGDGVSERNRHSSEMETERKKNYQRELMQQIEEKRRSIEELHDHEVKQEQALTKRLQVQLSTLKLEEALEQERIFANKYRLENNQDCLIRDKLVAKMENDSMLLQAKNSQNSQNTEEQIKEHDMQNKVYQYFSNSAHREYRRGQPLPVALEVDSLKLPILANAASVTNKTNIAHYRNAIDCNPLCNMQLQNCCVHCQQKYSNSVKHKPAKSILGHQQHGGNGSTSAMSKMDGSGRSFLLTCMKCERLYTVCICLTEQSICATCYCKRNTCLNCRRTLCSVCLDAIIADAEGQTHQFATTAVEGDSAEDNEMKTHPIVATNISMQAVRKSRLPFSTHIEQDSLFNCKVDLEAIRHNSHMSLMENVNVVTAPINIDRVRKETDKRLSHYFKYYGDLAQLRSRSTQTTPESAGRRDIVLHEENNLSMPLLREMPKMTRADITADQQGLSRMLPRNKIEQLKRRWEVPAVQKYKVSSSNPKVLTQVGAIRKQLQAADFN